MNIHDKAYERAAKMAAKAQSVIETMRNYGLITS